MTQGAVPAKVVLKIRREHKRGVPVADLAARFRLPYFTAYEIVRGWTYKSIGGPRAPRRRKRLTPSTRMAIVDLRQDGVTIKRISETVGLGQTTVKMVLKEARE